MAFGKIRLGRDVKKRVLHNLSFTNNTSSNWGFVQPIMGRELKPNDTANVSINDYIRLAPMPQPTFSKGVHYIKHARFVPYEDLYKPFANLMSGKPYSTPVGSYIPYCVPFFRPCDMTFAMFISDFAEISLYQGTNNDEFQLLTNTQTVRNSWGEWLESYSERYVIHSQIFNYVKKWQHITFRTTIDTAILVDSADVVLHVDDVHHNLIAIKFTNRGRNLRKVLLGLNYQLDVCDSSEVSALPLMAFYKAYFDAYFPQRYTTWTDTNLYSKLNYMIQYESYDFFETSLGGEDDELSLDILREISESYYSYSSPDFFSSQLDQPDLDKTGFALSSLSSREPDGAIDEVNPPGYLGNVAKVPYAFSSLGVLTAMQIWLVQKMQKYSNKDTVLGGKIRDYMLAHGLGAYLDEHNSNQIGTWSSNIQMFDVDQNTPTASSPLGNYAGKGIGSGQCKFSYTSNCYGYLVVLAAVVPECGYFQGQFQMHRHIERQDFYQPEFDSLGQVAIPATAMYANSYSNYGKHNDEVSVFGLLPRYSEYRYQPNIINGDISLPSTSAGLAGYTLDRWFKQADFHSTSGFDQYGKIHIKMDYANLGNIASGISWRFCNKYPWQGNFNRIFYNAAEQGILDDNFIIHHYIDFNLISAMLPQSEAYQTDEDMDNSIKVIKQ